MGSLNSRAELEAGGRGRRSGLLSFGNSGPFGSLLQSQRSRCPRSRSTGIITGFFIIDTIGSGSDNSGTLTALVYLYPI